MPIVDEEDFRMDELRRIVDELAGSHFAELGVERRERFAEELVQKVGKCQRRRRFSVGSDDEDSMELLEVETQTDKSSDIDEKLNSSNGFPSIKCLPNPLNGPHDEEILKRLFSGNLKHRELERHCEPLQAVQLRRRFLELSHDLQMDGLPSHGYDYKSVNGACCENLIGYIPVPTGIVGPLTINGESMHIPLATTEGALIASTNRGCKALVNGVDSVVFEDGMTRAPVLEFNSIRHTKTFKEWIQKPDVFAEIKRHFEANSRYCKLKNITTHMDGCLLFLRFCATTGDAMGMNMVSKATNQALDYIERCKEFGDKFKKISLSGNMCVDKKASALNWIEGRGKSVSAEAFVPASTVSQVLKCEVQSLVRLANAKLNSGSAASVSIGGSNAHAANIVAAMFIATGQDAAQVVSSSMCSTRIRQTDDGDLHITCTMNCLEVGTVGGGTILGPQHAMLKMLGCTTQRNPGDNAKRLAEIICATVLAGELSLLAAQCSDDLVRSHLTLNRSSINFNEINRIVPSEQAQNGNLSIRNHPSSSSSSKKSASTYRHNNLSHCYNIL